jgi:hypothetical protein
MKRSLAFVVLVACHATATADPVPSATASASVAPHVDPPPTEPSTTASAIVIAPSAVASASSVPEAGPPKAAITHVSILRETMTGQDSHHVEIDPTHARIDGANRPITSATWSAITHDIDASGFPANRTRLMCPTDQPSAAITVRRGTVDENGMSRCPGDPMSKLYDSIMARLPH